MGNKKPPARSFTWIVVLIVVVSMFLGNLLTIYSFSHRGYLGYLGKTGLARIIFLTDVLVIAICVATMFYENRPGKGK
jgi:hypothetical protein